jgi:hypothetical protein
MGSFGIFPPVLDYFSTKNLATLLWRQSAAKSQPEFAKSPSCSFELFMKKVSATKLFGKKKHFFILVKKNLPIFFEPCR